MTAKPKYLFLLVLGVLFYVPGFTQSKADSLSVVVRTTGNDTVKLKSLNLLFKQLYYAGKTDSALHCATYTKDLAEKLLGNSSLDSKTHSIINQQRILAYGNMGQLYLAKGVFTEALKYDTIALQIAREANDRANMANAYGNLGGLYTSQGNYVEALKSEFASLKIDEEINNKRGMASAYTNIGNSYLAENNYPEALKNHQECLRVSQEAGFIQGMIWAYNNMGDVYENSGKHDEAIKSYLQCLEASKKIGYKEGIGVSYANIGNLETQEGKYEDALKNETASLEIYTQLGYKEDATNLYITIGEVYLNKKKYDYAQSYLEKATHMATAGSYKEEAKHAYKDLSELYETLAKKGISPVENWAKANENYKLYDSYKDSLTNEVTTKKTVQAQMQFDFDRKEAASKEEQLKKDAFAAQEKQKQSFILDGFIAGFALLAVFVFFVFRGYRQKQKANVIISNQKEEVEKKNKVIESKNKDITDSINYAKRIQSAMLPSDVEISNFFKEYFILFQPKDIVSGDFYWFAPLNLSEGETKGSGIEPPFGGQGGCFIAAADCTGHGVPGAFMSLIGSEKLSDAVLQGKNTGEILVALNKGIKSSLRQSAQRDSTRDGMDIALCSLTPISSDGRSLQFSSANRPLWIVRKEKKEIEEIKPTKNSIGGFTQEDAVFETNDIKLQTGDTIYIFTDGYTDQFGGKEGKKLTTRKFRELILSICDKALSEQKERLNTFLNEWKGGHEQLDDILVMGIRI